MSDETMFEVFPEHRQLHDEAEERWGETAAWKQSAARTRNFSKEDWEGVKQAQEAVDRAYASLFADGVAPDDDRAADAAEAHRRFIDERFYACSHEMHASLAEMYVSDARFTAHYDQHGVGLAAWVKRAIDANAARHGS